MRIDCHVHIVGNGTGGTGCWCRPRGITRYGVPLMLGAIGLPRRLYRSTPYGLKVRDAYRLLREALALKPAEAQ